MATRSEREGKEALNKHHQAVFAQLMMDQANQFCADCRLKDPRWASWNLGIFVCIDCSGIHRSIGTHISKVKSVNLDTWTTEQVENMVAWGNQRANDYWEQSLGPNFRPDRSSVPPFPPFPFPPFPSSFSASPLWSHPLCFKRNMNNFIRAKYERKEFARGPPPKTQRVELPQISSQPPLQSQRSSSSVCAHPSPPPPIFVFFFLFFFFLHLSFFHFFISLVPRTRVARSRIRKERPRRTWTGIEKRSLRIVRPSCVLPVAQIRAETRAPVPPRREGRPPNQGRPPRYFYPS